MIHPDLVVKIIQIIEVVFNVYLQTTQRISQKHKIISSLNGDCPQQQLWNHVNHKHL
jgi:hypothetical protein